MTSAAGQASGWGIAPGRPVFATLLLGLLLSLAVAAALVGQVLYARNEVTENERQRTELLARVLEDHATRSIEAVSLAVATLSDLITRGIPLNDVALDSAIGQTLVNLPFLRSLAVVDGAGRITASSDPLEVGQTLDLATLGPLPVPGQDHLGGRLQGRRLTELRARPSDSTVAAGARDPSATDAGGAIPLVRTVLGPTGGRAHLVALINPFRTVS